ncbi:hypothetical protein HK105_206517 [Polyrhizophydium stewartii]|uniref:G-protein coupled receptors family 1 profile domain-containing protein n=1 Tax=Polyrhizophydium stewartii TaxID=2732419 RepID=A0ABR4N300_9FUNG
MPQNDLEPVEDIVRGIAVGINGAAAVANLGLIAAILRTPRLLSINEVALNMSLSISDFCFPTLIFVVVIDGWGNRAIFLDNHTICQLEGMAMQDFAIASMLTLLLISANNFLLIVLERPHPSRTQIAAYLVGLWILTFAWGLLPFATPGGGFAKQPSTFHCALDAGSDFPATVVVRLLNMCALGLTPLFIGGFYALILRKLWLSSRNLRQARRSSTRKMVGAEHKPDAMVDMATDTETNNTNTNATRPSTGTQNNTLKLQIAIVRRAVALVLVFMGFWGWYLIVIISEVVNGNKPASPLVESTGVLAFSFNALCNLIVLVLMDHRYRDAILKIVGRAPAAVGPRPSVK